MSDCERSLKMTAPSIEGVPTDQVFTALADAKRRQLLVLLQELDVPEQLSTLTRNLATTMDQSDDEIERLHIRLYHYHVPYLADAGLVTYTDDEQNVVALTERGQELAQWLDQ